ncbi:MAG: hypothetical protein ACOY31_06920 [Bacillota bacterium]
MYAVIATEENSEKIMRAAGEELFYTAFGTFDSRRIKKAFEGALMVPVNTLILDIDAGPPGELLEAVREYREGREDRVILIAPGRTPGDPLVAELVLAGVFDIIADEDWPDRLEKALSGPPADYSSAARWDMQDLEVTVTEVRGKVQFPVRPRPDRDRVPDGAPPAAASFSGVAPPGGSRIPELQPEEDLNSPPDPEPVPEPDYADFSGEISRYRDRILGTVTIAVAGAERGVGTTCTALAVASFLAREGHRVALAEVAEGHYTGYGQGKYFALDMLVKNAGNKAKVKNGFFKMAGVDMYGPCGDGETGFSYTRLYSQNYNYVVLDIGDVSNAGNRHIEEMRRSNMALLVAPASPWRGYGLANMYLGAAEEIPRLQGFHTWKIVFPAPCEKHFRRWRKLMGKSLDMYALPYEPDPFAPADKRDGVLRELLGPVLPQESGKKRRGLASLLRR